MYKHGDTNPIYKHQIYWCAVCDCNRVDSTLPDTGTFYQVFGHQFDTDDWHSVFFAICKECTLDKACRAVVTTIL